MRVQGTTEVSLDTKLALAGLGSPSGRAASSPGLPDAPPRCFRLATPGLSGVHRADHRPTMYAGAPTSIRAFAPANVRQACLVVLAPTAQRNICNVIDRRRS